MKYRVTLKRSDDLVPLQLSEEDKGYFLGLLGVTSDEYNKTVITEEKFPEFYGETPMVDMLYLIMRFFPYPSIKLLETTNELRGDEIKNILSEHVSTTMPPRSSFGCISFIEFGRSIRAKRLIVGKEFNGIEFQTVSPLDDDNLLLLRTIYDVKIVED